MNNMDGKTSDVNYLQAVTELLSTLDQSQQSAMEQTAEVIYRAVRSGSKFYVTGTGHSHIIAEEFYTRAGGLACVNMALPPEFLLYQHPLKSTMVERIAEYAQVVFTQFPIKRGDVLMIASNSGRNGLIVEMALEAKRVGAQVIALTSVKHSDSQSSRHSSGKKLLDVADIVIDNCGQAGDAAFPVGEMMMGATSTITGAFIVQRISIMIAEKFAQDSLPPPVFKSFNLDNSEEWNNRLFHEYYNIF